MPCGDITDRVTLVIDENDRIDSYRLIKKTCGGAVGLEDLLAEYMTGRKVSSILEQNEASLFRWMNSSDDLEEFLILKHFYAVRSVINAFLEFSSGGIRDLCTISGIEFENGQTTIDAEIKSDLLTDKIRACAHCGPG